jgi:tetrahydromethanopterin S-methyltransferase subunit G
MEKIEAEKNLEEIRKMLKETEEEVRQIAINSVDYQLLWGILVLAGMGLNILFSWLSLFVMIPIVWFLVMGIGGFFSYRLGKREFTKTGIITFVGKAVGMTWFATSIGIVLAIVLVSVTNSNPELIPAFIAILVGIGFFIHSFLLSWRLLSLTSPLWWLGAIIMAIYPKSSFALFAILLTLTYITPAIIIKLKQK